MQTAAPSRRHRVHRVWSEVWRVLAAAAVGLILLGIMLTEADTAGTLDQRDGLFAVDALLGIVSLVLLTQRRRAPMSVAFLLAAAGAVSSSSAGAAGIAIISLATQRRWRPLVIVAVPWVAAGLAYEMLIPSDDLDLRLSLGFGVVVYLLLVVVGYYIGTRRELVSRLRERADTAEQQQAMRLDQARIAERHRIAREMHDVLAHRISLIAMHSGALAFRDDLSGQQTRESAELIRDTSHQALQELRDVLGVLRARSVDTTEDDGAPARPERPQPTLVDLETLLEESRRAGLEVEVDLRLDAATVPDTLSRNSYRIVQEALTNARKHAEGGRVHLALSGSAGDRLTVRVRNGIPVPAGPAGALPSSGLGLMGLTERAVLAGGALTYGLDRRGDFVLEAWLPWST